MHNFVIMFLEHLVYILLWLVAIRYCIKWVSYHINHKNKKTRVFHGNTRMPFDVEFALMYGINAKTKTRFKFKDLSYRKNLVEWMCILDSLYPPDNKLNSTPPSHANPNPNLITPPSRVNANLVDRKRKPFPFPQFKTGDNNFIRIKKIYNVITAKPCAKNNNVVSSFLINTKIINLNNLKIPQNPIPFPKQTFACTRKFLWFCFLLSSFYLQT